MKFLSTIILALSTLSSYAATYTCTEIYNPALEVLRVRTSVVIEELSDISSNSSSREYDYVYKVKVRITEKLKSEIVSNREFITKADVADVYYSIQDSKENVSVYIYLDEEDEAGITYLTETGNKKEVRLSCSYKE